MRDPDYAEKDYVAIVKQMRENEPMSELSDPIEEEEEEVSIMLMKNEENKRKQRKFVKIERRILTNLPFFIIAIICVNSFTSMTPEIILIGVAMIIFVVCNLTWMPARWAKLLFLIPLIGAYIPYYIYEWKFGDYPVT